MPNISNPKAADQLHVNTSAHKGTFCIDNNTSLPNKIGFNI